MNTEIEQILDGFNKDHNYDDAIMGLGRLTDLAHLEGYGVGEMERIALATANSNMRSQLRQAKTWLAEARDLVVDWSAYAGDYFQKKHNLAGDIAEIEGRISELGS